MILLFELFLIENLYRKYTIVGSPPDYFVSVVFILGFRCALHVEALIPIRIKGLLDNGSRPRLLTADSGDGKRIRESLSNRNFSCVSNLRARTPSLTEDITFVQSISGDNYILISSTILKEVPGIGLAHLLLAGLVL